LEEEFGIGLFWDSDGSITATVTLLYADHRVTNEDCCKAIFQHLEEMGCPYTQKQLIQNCKVVFTNDNRLDIETTYRELNSNLETPIVYFNAADESNLPQEDEEDEPLDDRDCLESGTGQWAHQ